ncbi:hypothetical protein BOW37_12705 [Solemya velum gill symbiont]|uniref:hypothetical protein n=1 Tax=Solemya velum gill symbiont TaxID=2340 RepID=UPI0009989638|nr:hypothetical protein [Solemya velum gill symbiont]OOZ42749.1 hypothetical protein BOW37_12705 [Solemya velum gill symbiont]
MSESESESESDSDDISTDASRSPASMSSSHGGMIANKSKSLWASIALGSTLFKEELWLLESELWVLKVTGTDATPMSTSELLIKFLVKTTAAPPAAVM